MLDIILLGINHKTASVEVRECIAFAEEETKLALHSLLGKSFIKEALLFSTCNRVEILLVTDNKTRAVEETKAFIAEFNKIPLEQFEDALYLHEGDDAVRHVFRVASSLDSMVVGEPQILGQVKEAYRAAIDEKTSGVILNRLLHRTFFVAKRIRTETGIGDRAVSISYAAVELARKIFGVLADKTVMLIGAGEMAELAVEHLIRNKAVKVWVANRTFEKGVELARQFDGQAIRFDEIPESLKTVDIIISSTGAPDYVIQRDQVKGVLRKRKNRPLFFIDIAVPRDIDPEINRLANAYVYDIDDLNNVIETNLEERQREALKAEEIVAEEVHSFRRWLDAQQATPTIINLRRKYEEVKNAEVAKAMSMLGTEDPKMRKVVESLASSLLNKILHAPISSLKKDANGKNQMDLVTVVREIFDLTEASEPAGTGDADRSGEPPQD